MKHAIAATLLHLAAFAQAAGPPPKPDQYERLTTTEGIHFGIWPKRPAQPTPILFVLSGAMEETLGSSYFRQSGQYLADDGMLCVSIDLPCHGQDAKPDEKGLTGWRARCSKGEDFVSEVTGKLSKVLDYLIKEGLADPERIAALGTSRGGFIAAHFAMADPRVKAVMGFAPLTDLALITEFKGAETEPLVRKLALEGNVEALAGRSLWLVIGDRDTRVSTEAAIRFARAVTAASLAKGMPASVDLHVIAEPKGHTVPQGYAEIGAEWLRKQFGTQPAR